MIKHKHFFRLVFVFVALALVIPEEANAQRRGGRIFRFQNILEHDQRPYHFGFTVGVNTLDFALSPKQKLSQDYQFTHILPSQDYGVHIGIVSNLKLNQYFDLRFIPTFAFGDRYIDYYEGSYDAESSYRQILEPYLLDFPLHIKYKSVRMTNTRAYIIGGAKYSYDLGSYDGRSSTDDALYLRTNKHDFHYEIGVGFDHYFYYFKFSTEIKASFGFRNLILPGVDDTIFGSEPRHWESIDRLNSRSIMISFLFE
jgi:hypothetical protein